jgi:hypothetical protein
MSSPLARSRRTARCRHWRRHGVHSVNDSDSWRLPEREASAMGAPEYGAPLCARIGMHVHPTCRRERTPPSRRCAILATRSGPEERQGGDVSASGVARQRLWTVDFLFLIAIQTVGLFTYNMSRGHRTVRHHTRRHARSRRLHRERLHVHRRLRPPAERLPGRRMGAGASSALPSS